MLSQVRSGLLSSIQQRHNEGAETAHDASAEGEGRAKVEEREDEVVMLLQEGQEGYDDNHCIQYRVDASCPSISDKVSR